MFTDEQQVAMGVKLRTLASGRQERPLIVLWHDESTFYTRDVIMQQMWRDATPQAPSTAGDVSVEAVKVKVLTCFKKNTDLGQSLMVSAFVSEAVGLVHYHIHDRDAEKTKKKSDAAAALKAASAAEAADAAEAALEAAQTTGYWTGELFKEQVTKMIDPEDGDVLWKMKSLEIQLHMDHSSNHMKKPDDALDVMRLNIGRGYCRRRGNNKEASEITMRDGWTRNSDGEKVAFRMMEPDPTPGPTYGHLRVIGLRETLLRRGVAVTNKWTKEAMVQELSQHEDFQAAEEVTVLSEYVAARTNGRVTIVFMPKFH